jgi:cholesterol oxidase
MYNAITKRPIRNNLIRAWNDSMYSGLWDELNDNGYFDLGRSNLGATAVPPHIMNSTWYTEMRLQLANALLAGFPMGITEDTTELIELAVDWNKVEEEMNGTRVPSIIQGEVWLGCNSGAKRSLDDPTNYLGKAMATGLVDVKPLHIANRITYDRES